ncbi:MAG TPA: non-homologous end-joining DNA ligase [Solirubrobacteraceae bacterium]|nr:non-homologous end-joining DNA ligase [Solirubrobacteraceae bacterium]
MATEKLERYRGKRDFAKTPEPGAADVLPAEGTEPRFVVQEHHATRLHWDLRLEHEGVLASWAIPNGIPPTPKENRLAVRTEDHPLEYLDFHGEIPKGEYGAGTMEIWDTGTYETHKFEDAKVEVTFRGERLSGRYGLFPIGKRASGGGSENDWMIHRMDPPAPLPDGREREPMPERIVPMMAESGELPGDESRWSYEVKWDGVRAIAYVKPGRLRLESRNLNEITDAYPEVRGILLDLGMHEAVLDGEIVAFDDAGKPSFERLQTRMHVTAPSTIKRLSKSSPVVYAIFDLLHLDGETLMRLPYEQRRERLEQLGLGGPAWRVPAAHRGAGRRLLDATREQGLEGVVAKRLDSRYEPGRRNGCWIKVKHLRRQELVIGGWLPGEGRRAERIGALLMGYYESDAGERRFRYAGRVGTGFTERMLNALMKRLAPLRATTNPFDDPPKLPRNAEFVTPELVADIEFRQWTGDGVMRAPSFKGLRDDKPAADVVREPVGTEEELEMDATPDPSDPSDTTGISEETSAPVEDGMGARRSSGEGAPPRDEAGAESPEGAPPRTEARSPVGARPKGRAKARAKDGAKARPADGARPEELFDDVARRPDGALAVTVDGRALKLSNWHKVLYPETGFTKGDLIAYYARIAPVVVAHLHDRPLTLKRYPNGVEKPYFYEKQSPSHRPEWVQTVRVSDVDYTLCQDRATLVWLANLADIELHTSLSLKDDPQRPTMLVFDLDPGAPAGLVECSQVALVLRGLFSQLGLESVVKTSGSKGMQVYVPLNTDVTYERTKPFARTVAELLEQRLSELVVSRMTKRLRPGRVLVDWSQNDAHKTTVNVYSVRAKQRPTISAPVSWDEVQRCRDEREPELLSFGPDDVLARVAADGDPFAILLSAKQRLPKV